MPGLGLGLGLMLALVELAAAAHWCNKMKHKASDLHQLSSGSNRSPDLFGKLFCSKVSQSDKEMEASL